MSQADFIWGVVGFLLTLMIFSYIFGDNPVFRLASYIFVGVTAGFVTLIVITQVIVPHLFTPLFTGTLTDRLIMLVPLVLALVLLLKIYPPTARFANIPMAYLVGAGAAILIGGAVLGTIFPQVTGTINAFDLNTTAPGQSSLAGQLFFGLLILVGVVTSLFFFYFGARTQPNQAPKRNQVIETMARIGQVFIGVSLGALFAGVYASALTSLIERVSTLWNFVHALLG